MTAPRPGIVWYRDDLRISDHPALKAASNAHASVVCIYVLDDKAPGASAARGRGALVAGAVTARPAGEPAQAGRVAGVAQGIGAEGHRRAGARDRCGSVYWNEIAQSPHRAVADEVAAALGEIGVAAQRFPGDLLAAPSQIRNKENRGLRVFTPFWRRVQALGDPPKPLPAPKQAERRTGPRKR